MSTEIQKYEALSAAIKAAMQKEEIDDLQVGDMFISTDNSYIGEILRVKGFKNDKKFGVYVLVEYAKDWEGIKWGGTEYNDGEEHEKQYSLTDFKNYYLGGSYESSYHKAIKLERGKSVKEYYEEAMNIVAGKADITKYQLNELGEVNEDRALMHKGSKEALIALQEDLEKRSYQVSLLAAFVKYEMERKRRELDKIKEQLYGMVAEFQKKISKIMRVITTIELYLGINEELFQIQDGPKASATEPIQFRQAVLFMDEEIGHWEGGGLDFENISWFDEWLVKNENFKNLIPEQKGLLVFRPRRNEKEYEGDNHHYNAKRNRENMMKTYLLIRNGECLYRIYTENITILPRLFPQRTELQDLLNQLDKEMQSESFWTKKDNQEKAEDLIYQYKKRAALMQGLIDRSEVFHPLAKHISIYKMDEAEGLINFIYDDELTLPSGRLPFWEWWAEINKKIQPGTRVLNTGSYMTRGWYNNSNFSDRFYNRSREHNIPNLPSEGIYVIEEFSTTSLTKTRKGAWLKWLKQYPNQETDTDIFKLLKIKKDYYKWGAVSGKTEMELYKGDMDCYFVLFTKKQSDLTIKYNPEDTVYHGWGGSGDSNKRKNNLRFIVYKDDRFIMNYDQIDLDDINFYLTSRADRHNYLGMMPILQKIKEERLKEIASEKEFIRFILRRNAITFENDKTELLRRTMECIRWWKYKNKWKRPIAKDDTLALRMIEKRLLSPNYPLFKKYSNNE